MVRCHFDHCPILLESDPGNGVYLPRPFRFQIFWLKDLTFPRVVLNTRDRSSSLQEASEKFATKVVDWNKNYFDNIFVKKKWVMARLSGVQKALRTHPSSSLLALENKLHSELNDILNQEEELWVQKSRINRLVHGDRNISFHHVSAIVQRRRNRISCIKNDARKWIHNEREIVEFIRRGFDRLFMSSLDSVPLTPPQPSQWQSALSKEEKNTLCLPISDAEIKDGLWAMKLWKSPSLDGLHARFFQRFWSVVGELVKKVVKLAFEERKIPSYLNKTNITLIPKISSLETLGNYHPISLCNTVYEIVTKIIVCRLRPFLDKLISPFQSVFVPRRKRLDNAIVVQ